MKYIKTVSVNNTEYDVKENSDIGTIVSSTLSSYMKKWTTQTNNWYVCNPCTITLEPGIWYTIFSGEFEHTSNAYDRFIGLCTTSNSTHSWVMYARTGSCTAGVTQPITQGLLTITATITLYGLMAQNESTTMNAQYAGIAAMKVGEVE